MPPSPLDPDQFTIAEDELKPAQLLVDAYLREVVRSRFLRAPRPEDYEAGRDLLGKPADELVLVVRALLARWRQFAESLVADVGLEAGDSGTPLALKALLSSLLSRKPPFTEPLLCEWLDLVALPGGS